MNPYSPLPRRRLNHARYDALGNLLRVDQKGSAPADSTQWRTRTFTYDSLGRLMTAHNPESGTITYAYDADGELLQKTSPAPNQTGATLQTISFCYDELHRVTGKGYGAQSCPLASPVVSYTYDVGANAKGKLTLTHLMDQAGTADYSYDSLGRLTGETRVISGISKSLSYAYNLDGSLKAMAYPSGATVTYAPDSAGRPLSAVDSANGINYATSATYNAPGSLVSLVNGNSGTFAGITNTFSYNQRLQPVNMSASAPSQTVFSIGYDFHLGAGNNGNVFGITNYKDNARNQAFTYDALNRLTSAQNAGTNCAATVIGGRTEYWGNAYGYDAWGNLLQKTITKCGAENLSVFAAVNNQLTGGYSYDAAGNMMHDGTSGLNYSYDQENRITGAGGYTYTYDGDGNRVKKSNGTGASAGTLYWYMTPGIVAESDQAGTLKSEYVFFGGERVARRDLVAPTGVSYYFSDHLKTASVITDAAGNIKAESDYYPWGGELQFVANDSNHYKFTGKERDSESGLDYFGARYYSNGLGRFISADWSATPVPVPYADFGDPQSLNLYTYVRNLPTTKADADGHCDLGGICGIVVNYISNWASFGIAKEGGKQFAKDAGIGTAKSVGSAAYHMVMQSNPVTGMIDHIHGEPKSLQPKNDVQAGAKNITTGIIITASVAWSAAALGTSVGIGGGASSLTPAEIEAGLANATLRTTQGEISAPVVNRFIDMSRAGSEAPPIKVDGDIIVDGNHRYAAGVLEGKPPATTPGTVAPSQVPNAKPFSKIKVTPTDYGNH